MPAFAALFSPIVSALESMLWPPPAARSSQRGHRKDLWVHHNCAHPMILRPRARPSHHLKNGLSVNVVAGVYRRRRVREGIDERVGKGRKFA